MNTEDSVDQTSPALVLFKSAAYSRGALFIFTFLQSLNGLKEVWGKLWMTFD